MDVSFASFLCAREKEGKIVYFVKGERTFGYAELTPVNYVFLCHDSAIRVNTMALAVPSVRKNPNEFGPSVLF